MKKLDSTRSPRHHVLRSSSALGLATAFLVTGIALGGMSSAHAAESPVGLGTAEPFAVLAGSAVSNTGASVLTGDLGVSPGTAVTGFPPGLVGGTQHVNDAVALQAQSDLVTAYDDAAGRSTTRDVTGEDLGGQTLVSGVYSHGSGMALTGTVTLDAQGDPNAVFIFQAASTLITAPNSTVALINGASPCNVFWQVGSSATLDTNTTFVGTVMALTSATLNTGADVEGRILARNGAVTLDTNLITAPDCSTTSPTTSPNPSTPPGSTDNPTVTTDSPSSPARSTPTIPSGHPETGLGGSVGQDTGSTWAIVSVFAGLSALGGVLFSRRGTRHARQH